MQAGLQVRSDEPSQRIAVHAQLDARRIRGRARAGISHDAAAAKVHHREVGAGANRDVVPEPDVEPRADLAGPSVDLGSRVLVHRVQLERAEKRVAEADPHVRLDDGERDPDLALEHHLTEVEVLVVRHAHHGAR